MLLLCLTLPNKVEFFLHLEPEHSPEACLGPGTCACVSTVKSKYTVFSSLKKLPLIACTNCPPNLINSKSNFLRVSFLLAGKFFLKCQKPKNLLWVSLLNIFKVVCRVTGKSILLPSPLLEGRVPVSPVLLAALPHFPPLHPVLSQFQSSAGNSC